MSNSNTAIANEACNALSKLARLIDDDYAEACLDTSMSNRPPINDREALVSLLEATSHIANFLTDPDAWTSDFDQEPRVQVPWGYLTSHRWTLPPRTGLPEHWQSLPARRIVSYLTTQDPQVQDINPRDREQILEELDRRDTSGR